MDGVEFADCLDGDGEEVAGGPAVAVLGGDGCEAALMRSDGRVFWAPMPPPPRPPPALPEPADPFSIFDKLTNEKLSHESAYPLFLSQRG